MVDGGPIYLDGGALIRSFLAERLVDELTVTMVPVVLVPASHYSPARHGVRT